MNITPEILLYLLIGVAVIFLIALALTYLSLKKSIAAVPQVGISERLQSQINDLVDVNQKQASLNKKISDDIAGILPKLQTITDTATVRYNPFRDAGVGGLQSFSTAFLDKHGVGVVLTNLYSREMSRVSIKEITNWECESQKLSPEEVMVIKQIRDKQG